MKVLLLIFLVGIVFSEALLACTITMDGDDVTDEFLVEDSITGETYVDCMEHAKCQNAIITDCAVIKCFGTEACNLAQIINFTKSVLCEGLHACHRTEMIAAATDDEKTVSCVGSGACDVAQMSGENLEQVTCTGHKACRKVVIDGANLVKCHEGSGTSEACSGFATMAVDCLYCGKNGCASHVNQCRYKILGEDESERRDEYVKCQPETVIGNCPDDLEEALLLELSGKEEIDMDGEGGIRRR